MVTQTITINLTQSRLAPIIMRSEEKGREFQFDVIDEAGEPEDLTGYDLKFMMLKPDGNVVYKAISSLGILTQSEQMTTSKGKGYYCIRIMDNDTIIYSGQGPVVIDDHVIDDETLESISEVDGYVFPDDFATVDQIESVVEDLGFAKIADNRQNFTETWSSEHISQKIADGVGDLIQDDQISEDHTWSSNKINYELTGKAIIDDETTSTQSTWSSSKIDDALDDIEVLDNYSETEKIVGTWIDGKTLYEKTFKLTNISGSGYYDTGVTYDSAFIKDGFILLSDNNQMCPLNVFFDPYLFIWAIVERTGKIDYRLQPYSGTMYITIRYTKSV